MTVGTNTITVDKRERSILTLRPNSATQLSLTGCVTRSSINYLIELWGSSGIVPLMGGAGGGVGRGALGGEGGTPLLSRELGKLCRRKSKRAEKR